MALAHCIFYAIYVRVLFIIKIVLCYTIDVLLKSTCPNPTLGLFLNCLLKDCTSKLTEHLFSSTPLCLVHETIKSLTKSLLRLWKQ